MSKNISNKKYLNLEKKYKCVCQELEDIKKTNMYLYSDKMPKLIKKWLFGIKNDINILQINKENIEFESGKVTFIVNTESYSNLDKIIQQIINLMYINYEVFLLCTNDEKYIKYTNLDQRIKIIKFSNSKEKNNIYVNVNQVINVTNSEYLLYINDFYLEKKYILNNIIKNLNHGTDLIIFKSKINNISYAVFFKKQYMNSLFKDLKFYNINDLEKFEKYKNVKIKFV